MGLLHDFIYVLRQNRQIHTDRKWVRGCQERGRGEALLVGARFLS